jgi:hypothetical protein
MKIKEIKYLVPPMDPVNDCLDVFVSLEDKYCTDEFSYLVEVTTPQFLSALMKESESDFVTPGYPYIIVSKLPDETIKSAIQSFLNEDEDSDWLKLYQVPATLEIEDLNEILDRKNQENLELESEIDAESILNKICRNIRAKLIEFISTFRQLR